MRPPSSSSTPCRHRRHEATTRPQQLKQQMACHIRKIGRVSIPNTFGPGPGPTVHRSINYRIVNTNNLSGRKEERLLEPSCWTSHPHAHLSEPIGGKRLTRKASEKHVNVSVVAAERLADVGVDMLWRRHGPEQRSHVVLDLVHECVRVRDLQQILVRSAFLQTTMGRNRRKTEPKI